MKLGGKIRRNIGLLTDQVASDDISHAEPDPVVPELAGDGGLGCSAVPEGERLLPELQTGRVHRPADAQNVRGLLSFQVARRAVGVYADLRESEKGGATLFMAIRI